MQILQAVRDGTPRAMARDQIQRYIAKQKLRRGDQLPTYAQFCGMLGFSLLTVQRAMGDLANGGIVYRLHGKGSYVGKAQRLGTASLARVGLVHNASLNNLIEAPYLNQMLAGILSACTARGIDLTILALNRRESRVSASELASQVDGLLLVGIVNSDFVRSLLKARLPLVLVDNRLEGLLIDTVVVDNLAAVQTELRSIIALGHRRIAYVTGRTPDPFTGKLIESSDAVERREAYAAVMTEAGLAREIRVLPGRGGNLADLVAVAKSDDAPTAYLTYAVSTAVALHRAFVAAGIQVPEAVSLAGVAGVPADVAECDLDLDYGRVDFRAMGVAAIEALERRCGAKPPDGQQLIRIGVERARGRSIIAPEGPLPESDLRPPRLSPASHTGAMGKS